MRILFFHTLGRGIWKKNSPDFFLLWRLLLISLQRTNNKKSEQGGYYRFQNRTNMYMWGQNKMAHVFAKDLSYCYSCRGEAIEL